MSIPVTEHHSGNVSAKRSGDQLRGMHALTCAVVCQADKRLYNYLLRGYGTQKLPLLMQHSQYLHRNRPMFKTSSQMQQGCVMETHVTSCIWTTCWQLTFTHAQMQNSLVSPVTATLGMRSRHQHASDEWMCIQDIDPVLHETGSYTDTDQTTGTLRHVNRLLHETGSYTDIDESTGNLMLAQTCRRFLAMVLTSCWRTGPF